MYMFIFEILVEASGMALDTTLTATGVGSQIGVPIA